MNLFKQFIKSFYKFEDYPILITTKGFKVALYVFMLTFITFLSFIVPLFVSYFQVGGIKGFIDTEIPDFEVKNGKLTIEQKIDYSTKEKNMRILIDPSGKEILTSDSDKYINCILADSNKIIIKNIYSTNVYEFKDFQDMSKKDIYDIIPFLKSIMIATVILTYIFLLIFDLFAILMFTAIANFINIFIMAPVSYTDKIKITVYSRTMPIILRLLLGLIGIQMPFVIYFAVVCAYIYLALKNIKSQNGCIIAVL